MFMFSLYFHRYLAVAATPRDLDGGGGCSDGMGEGDEEGESKGGAAGGALLSVPLGEVGGGRVGPKWTDMAALEELCLALVLALVDAARTLSSEDAVVRAMANVELPSSPNKGARGLTAKQSTSKYSAYLIPISNNAGNT